MNAHSLSLYQRCPRRWRIEQTWRPRRWPPRELFLHTLRLGILQLSQGRTVEEVTKRVQTQFIEACANPGLDVLTDPYTLAQDFCCALGTVLEKVGRGEILRLAAEIPQEGAWEITSPHSDNGELQRWTVMERVNQDSILREAHSWQCTGDMAVARVPLTLHIVELGRVVKGRLHSPWALAQRHPLFPSKFRFQRMGGEKLRGDWKPFWAQGSGVLTKEWVDQMDKDGLELIHHIMLKEIPQEKIEGIQHDMLGIVNRMAREPKDWREIPMWRPACDIPPCPWQDVCYGGREPEEVGSPLVTIDVRGTGRPPEGSGGRSGVDSHSR